MYQTFKSQLWTSDLTIDYNSEKEISWPLDKILGPVESLTTEDNRKGIGSKAISLSLLASADFIRLNDYEISYEDLFKFGTYKQDGTHDFTGLAKGVAIQRLSQYLQSKEVFSYCINFGGDILAYKFKRVTIQWEFPKLKYNLSKYGTFCLFTSGNYDNRRGSHIKSFDDNSVMAAFVISEKLNPVQCDMEATLAVANKNYQSKYNNKITRIDWNSKFI